MMKDKCPVCGWDLEEGGIRIQVAGKEIRVCCDECAAKMKENPAAFGVR